MFLTIMGPELISPSRRTHPRHVASKRQRKVASWRSWKSVAYTIGTSDAQPDATRSSRLAVTVLNTRDLLPRTNRTPAARHVGNRIPDFGSPESGPGCPNRCRILFGERSSGQPTPTLTGSTGRFTVRAHCIGFGEGQLRNVASILDSARGWGTRDPHASVSCCDVQSRPCTSVRGWRPLSREPQPKPLDSPEKD